MRAARAVIVHLVDATYELFRCYFGAPAARATRQRGADSLRPERRGGEPQGRGGVPSSRYPPELLNKREVAATRALMRGLLAFLARDGVTHVAYAFDHVIESFRNALFAGYKTSEGVPQELLDQFPLAERGAHALGVVVWPMVEFEADDALATAAARFAGEQGVEQVRIWSPDKDLTQCVRGSRVVCVDRMRGRVLDEAAVRERFGVPPSAIPDWLALVGDSADGYPGLPGWGAKSASALLAHYERAEAIPDDAGRWPVRVRGPEALARSLREHREELALYRRLATLRIDVPLAEELDDLRWRGARRDALEAFCAEVGEKELPGRVHLWRE